MSEMRVVLMVAGDAAELLSIGARLQVLAENWRDWMCDCCDGFEHGDGYAPLAEVDVQTVEGAAERLIAIWRGRSSEVSFPLGVGGKEANDV